MADSALRQRLEQDATGVLAEEFSKHRDRLRRMAEFRLDPVLAARVDPEDVMQEAWIAAVQRLEHFRRSESLSFFVWLRMIVAQTLVDIQRRHLGAKMRDAYRQANWAPPDFSGSTSLSLVARLLGSMTSPSGAMVREERARQLRAAIEGMESIDREVLALRHFEELTNSEVAEVLGIEQKAASIRYVRALRRLKEILSGLPEFAERDR